MHHLPPARSAHPARTLRPARPARPAHRTYPALELVSDRGGEARGGADAGLRSSPVTRAHETRPGRPGGRPAAARQLRSIREHARTLATDERGAVTAEYAIVIMAAVAFAGLLVAIMRSSEIRAMLVRLVENALGAAN